MGHSDYKERKFISFANGYIYQYLLFQCQNLKNEAWFPWCSNLSSNSLGEIFLNEIINLFKMSCFIYLDKKKQRKRLVPTGAGSILIGMSIFWLKTMLPIVKKHLFMRKDIALTSVCLVKYLPLMDRCFRKANAFSDFRFEYKIDNFWKLF